MRRVAVLAIANRLGANQALGDLVERIARVWRSIDGGVVLLPSSLPGEGKCSWLPGCEIAER